MATRITYIGDAEITIEHLSDFMHDHICIFCVTHDNVATMYFSDVPMEVAHQSKTNLAKYLLDNILRAQVLKSFAIPHSAT